jgi:hypothetical protein
MRFIGFRSDATWIRTRQTILGIIAFFMLTTFASIPFRFHTTFDEKIWLVSIIPIFLILAGNFVNEIILGGIQNANPRIKKITDIYENYENVPEYCKILSLHLEALRKISKIFFSFQALIYHTPVLGGVILSLWNQQFIYSLSLYVPFLDRDSLVGFIVNTILQIFGSILVFFCMISFNLDHILMTTQVIPFVDILCCKMKEFRSFIEKRKMREKSIFHGAVNCSQTNRKLLDFVMSYELYQNFVDNFSSDAHKFIYFVVVSISAIAIGLSGFVACKYSIFIGICLSIVYFFNIAFFCFFGSMMEHQNQKLLNEFYNFPWYELSQSQKKVFLLMLMVLQNASQINVPIIGNVNVELMTDVLNSSYSYLTFLINFL